ncbi:MAG TPA: hypothetical protein VFH35_09835 [Ramlibacter sp.]|nr:hypothetical protein [Ramlibacter sp.]
MKSIKAGWTLTALAAALLAGPVMAQSGNATSSTSVGAGTSGSVSSSPSTNSAIGASASTSGNTSLGTSGVATSPRLGGSVTATGIAPADGSQPGAALSSSGGAGATVGSGTGGSVSSGTGVAVTPGTAGSTTYVMGSGAAPSANASGTVVTSAWVNMPPNVEGRPDFQRWMRLR